jgi:hypothetical protein
MYARVLAGYLAALSCVAATMLAAAAGRGLCAAAHLGGTLQHQSRVHGVRIAGTLPKRTRRAAAAAGAAAPLWEACGGWCCSGAWQMTVCWGARSSRAGEHGGCGCCWRSPLAVSGCAARQAASCAQSGLWGDGDGVVCVRVAGVSQVQSAWSTTPCSGGLQKQEQQAAGGPR